MKGRLVSNPIWVCLILLLCGGGVVGLVSARSWLGSGKSALTFHAESHGAGQAQRQAETIASGICAYEQREGAYPESLDVLLDTGDRSTIPPPVYGAPQWIYYQGGEKRECSIGFGTEQGVPALHYHVGEKRWSLDE